jgi:hypothetical protein
MGDAVEARSEESGASIDTPLQRKQSDRRRPAAALVTLIGRLINKDVQWTIRLQEGSLPPPYRLWE